MAEPTGYQCRICEGDMVPEHSGDTGHSVWVECLSCGKTEQLNLMLQERLVNSPMRRERDALRAEVAHYKAALDADRGVIARLQAELAKYNTPLTDEQAEHLASYHDNTAANWRYLDGEIRAAREGER